MKSTNEMTLDDDDGDEDDDGDDGNDFCHSVTTSLMMILWTDFFMLMLIWLVY